MRDKSFLYLQYNKIEWKNQDNTKINSAVDKQIIEIILKRESKKIKVFDIGFGTGFFIESLSEVLTKKYKDITIEGCEPSKRSYENFAKRGLSYKNIKLITYNTTFQELETKEKFDFITANYVFPHFIHEELDSIIKKIHSMLEDSGRFILVVAEESYIKEKLAKNKELLIEENIILLNNKKYKEFLHYSEIPEIGKVIDYNREEEYYLHLFNKNKFELEQKTNLDDNRFIGTIFVFKKNTY